MFLIMLNNFLHNQKNNDHQFGCLDMMQAEDGKPRSHL